MSDLQCIKEHIGDIAHYNKIININIDKIEKYNKAIDININKIEKYNKTIDINIKNISINICTGILMAQFTVLTFNGIIDLMNRRKSSVNFTQYISTGCALSIFMAIILHR